MTAAARSDGRCGREVPAELRRERRPCVRLVLYCMRPDHEEDRAVRTLGIVPNGTGIVEGQRSECRRWRREEGFARSLVIPQHRPPKHRSRACPEWDGKSQRWRRASRLGWACTWSEMGETPHGFRLRNSTENGCIPRPSELHQRLVSIAPGSATESFEI